MWTVNKIAVANGKPKQRVGRTTNYQDCIIHSIHMHIRCIYMYIYNYTYIYICINKIQQITLSGYFRCHWHHSMGKLPLYMTHVARLIQLYRSLHSLQWWMHLSYGHLAVRFIPHRVNTWYKSWFPVFLLLCQSVFPYFTKLFHRDGINPFPVDPSQLQMVKRFALTDVIGG
jgi:hypothetical protein